MEKRDMGLVAGVGPVGKLVNIAPELGHDGEAAAGTKKCTDAVDVAHWAVKMFETFVGEDNVIGRLQGAFAGHGRALDHLWRQ